MTLFRSAATMTSAGPHLQGPTLQVLPVAVAANVRRVQARTDARIMAVVKADGYGHGAIAVAQAAVAAGAEQLGVTDIAEGSVLRAAGLTVPILAWLHPSGIDAARAAADRIDVAVASVDELRQLIVDAGPLGDPAIRVHLNVDTGMARGGCPSEHWEELFRLARAGHGLGRIDVVALMGHLPLADYADPAQNAAAVLRMEAAVAAAHTSGLGRLLVHLAATSGALTDRATHFDMVRIGAGLVGIDPSGTIALNGASRLTAPIVHTARTPRGTPVGYGGMHVTDRDTHLSVIGLGYADGIPRGLSANAAVEIGGRRHRIVGRVSMDQIVIDTGAEAFPHGTTATVFGPDGGAVPSIHEWADWAATIPHTIVAGIGPRVKRSTT
ncbi:alanine racemase [Microbacterium sp. LTA6]|uniref:alanine racemase n=1 Tax=Microbacterium sp. LTA6 TaxID=3129771 RepID=UPI003248A605